MKCMISAAAMALAALGLAGVANAAPSGPVTASETVSSLQADGFHVILNKVGTAPLDGCSVTSVRPGQTFAGGFGGARCREQPRHDGHVEDRLRRRRVLTERRYRNAMIFAP